MESRITLYTTETGRCNKWLHFCACPKWWKQVCLTHIIDPLQLVIHAVQILHVGEQKMHCDKTNKGNCYFKWCQLFVCLSPMGLLLSSMAICNSGTTIVAAQRAYCRDCLVVRSLIASALKGSVWSKGDKSIVFRLLPLFFIYIDKISFSQMTSAN